MGIHDEYESIWTHWIALCVNDKNLIYFNSFGVQHIPKETKTIIGNKNIITNIYRMQAYDLMMFGYVCIGFIDLMLKGKVCLILQICFLLMILKRMIK